MEPQKLLFLIVVENVTKFKVLAITVIFFLGPTTFEILVP